MAHRIKLAPSRVTLRRGAATQPGDPSPAEPYHATLGAAARSKPQQPAPSGVTVRGGTKEEVSDRSRASHGRPQRSGARPTSAQLAAASQTKAATAPLNLIVQWGTDSAQRMAAPGTASPGVPWQTEAQHHRPSLSDTREGHRREGGVIRATQHCLARHSGATQRASLPTKSRAVPPTAE